MSENIIKINLKKLSLKTVVNLFNKYHYKLDSLENKNKKINKKNDINISINKLLYELSYEDRFKFSGVTNETQIIFKLKNINKILHFKRADLTKIHTERLIKTMKRYRFDYSETDYFFIDITNSKSVITNLISLRKELNTRENILSKSEKTRIRKVSAKYKITKEEAIKRINEGRIND